MLFWMTVQSAFVSLVANKMRSVLAMLGIIIGVSAVIAMLAIGAAAKKQMLSRITAMGSNLLMLMPGQRGTRGVMNGKQQTLTLEDAMAISRLPGVAAASPVVRGAAQVKYYSRNSSVPVTGAALTYFAIRDSPIDQGRSFSEAEAEGLARVAVIGVTVAQDLMGDADPVDQVIKLNGVNFRVVGVLAAKGDQGFFNPDNQVIIPYSTAMKQVFGVARLGEVDVQAVDETRVNAVEDAMTALLRKRHHLTNDVADDFQIANQAEILAVVSDYTMYFTILLGGIAGISLLVGGIGIMNIMLVSVTERTREIGTRKAIGAKQRDILLQFLVESVVMSGMGGLIGIAAGFGFAFLIAYFSPLKAFVQIFSVLIALLFSAGVGVFFGLYPAWRAAQLDPIEALRYE